MSSISFNPSLTTVSNGLFDGPSSSGGVQGTAMPDPAVRFQLRSGILAPTETLPMWGGIAIYENVPTDSVGLPSHTLGSQVGRATTVTGGSYPIAGFSVFDQAYGMVNTPQSPVPTTAAYGQVMSYRLGSGARIWLGCDPGLISVRGQPISTGVAWDFVNQQLIPLVPANAVTAGTYNQTTGLVTLTLTTAANLSPGDTVIVSGATGTGSYASINGTYTAGVGTTGSTVTYTIATGLTLTITGGSLTTGSALPVTILNVSSGNSQTVNYSAGTGYATWNFAGSTALVQI